MDSRQALCLAAALWCGSVAGWAQTVVGVSQGGTGANTPAGARAKLGAAPAAHTHTLNELQGITGKSGTGSLLATFGGGPAEEATCAMFDASGNLVSTGHACGVTGLGTTFTQSFSNVSSLTLNHGLGSKNVVVACYDASDRLVNVNSIRVPTLQQAEVTFTTPQSGRCVVQGAGGMEVSGPVNSVFGRQGEVSAAVGDYSFAMIAGVAGLAQGGTNQSTWTAGRCVQVSADGTRLESAGEACGTGTNSVTTGPGLLGSGTEADPLRVNPATVPSFLNGGATLNDWGTIGAQACVQKSFALAGAVTNDAVIPRWPAGLPADLTGIIFVPGADTIAVRVCNPTAAGVALANGHVFGATILRSF